MRRNRSNENEDDYEDNFEEVDENIGYNSSLKQKNKSYDSTGKNNSKRSVEKLYFYFEQSIFEENELNYFFKMQTNKRSILKTLMS